MYKSVHHLTSRFKTVYWPNTNLVRDVLKVFDSTFLFKKTFHFLQLFWISANCLIIYEETISDCSRLKHCRQCNEYQFYYWTERWDWNGNLKVSLKSFIVFITYIFNDKRWFIKIKFRKSHYEYNRNTTEK